MATSARLDWAKLMRRPFALRPATPSVDPTARPMLRFLPMANTVRWLVSAAAMLLCSVGSSQCGGKAVVDSSFDGDDAADTTSTDTTTGSSSTTAAPANTELCDAVCHDMSSCLLDGGCSAACQRAAPSCAPLHAAWLQCLDDAVVLAPVCNHPNGCNLALSDWYGCAVEETPQTCEFAGDGSCLCTIEQRGGDGATYQARCSPESHGTSCDCLVDGALVGSCRDAALPGDACHVVFGCCGLLFYVPFGAPA